MEEKPNRSFLQQAARASWILPLATIGLMAVGNSAMQDTKSPVTGLVMGGTFLLLLVAGLVFGIVGCFGAKRHGPRTTIVPGIVGAVLNAAILGLLVAIAVPSFLKARGAALQKRTAALQQLADQTNRQLPVMADAETRVDSVSVLSANLIEYRYTFVNELKDTFDTEAYIAEARPQVLENYQTSDQFKMFRENGIHLLCSYHDKNGELIASIRVPEEEPSNKIRISSDSESNKIRISSDSESARGRD